MKSILYIVFVICNFSCTETGNESVDEIEHCLGQEMFNALELLKNNMYENLERTYNRGNQEQNLKRYFEDRVIGHTTLLFEEKDCDVLRLIRSHPFEDKFVRKSYDTAYYNGTEIVSIVDQDTNWTIEVRPNSTTAEEFLEIFIANGYSELMEKDKWLDCLERQAAQDTFLVEYISVRKSVGKISAHIFANAMIKLGSKYLSENSIIERIIALDLYYEELKRNKC